MKNLRGFFVILFVFLIALGGFAPQSQAASKAKRKTHKHIKHSHKGRVQLRSEPKQNTISTETNSSQASSAHDHSAQDPKQDFVSDTKKLPGMAGQDSFCIRKDTDENDVPVIGVNDKKMMRPASISKLFTSYWALSELGANYRFETKIHYSKANNSLHFEGSMDPMIGRRVLFFVLSELNRHQIYSVQSVSFDENFVFFGGVEASNNFHEDLDISSQQSLAELRSLINTKRWDKKVQDAYEKTYNLSQQLGVNLAGSVSFAAGNVTVIEKSKFKASSDDVVLVYHSAPLYRYLKFMNVWSYNYLADSLFDILGGEGKFKKFIQKDLGLDSEDIVMHTGSGLPADSSKRHRTDNYITCEATLDILEALEDEIQQSHYDIHDIMMVAGVDEGTLKKQKYNDDELDGAIVAKTGTLSNAISLAGYISTVNGRYLFSMFLASHASGFVHQAKIARDNFMKHLVQDLGGKKTITSDSPPPFIPFDKNSIVQQQNPKIESKLDTVAQNN